MLTPTPALTLLGLTMLFSVALSDQSLEDASTARLVTVTTDMAKAGSEALLILVLAIPFIVGGLITQYWASLLG